MKVLKVALLTKPYIMCKIEAYVNKIVFSKVSK